MPYILIGYGNTDARYSDSQSSTFGSCHRALLNEYLLSAIFKQKPSVTRDQGAYHPPVTSAPRTSVRLHYSVWMTEALTQTGSEDT